MSDGDYILDADGNAQISLTTSEDRDYVKSLYNSEKFKEMTKIKATRTIVKEIINGEHPNLELRIFKKDQQTFADLVMEVKSTMRINGLTLNDRFREMFDNPNSAFQKSMRWKKADDGSYVYDGSNVDGNNPEAKKVLELIRQYEQAAKTWVLYNAYNGNEKGDKPIFYERELELGDKLLVKFLDYEGISKDRMEHINRLTNGN